MQEEGSTRAQYPDDFAQRVSSDPRVDDVMDHIHAVGKVETTVGVGKRTRIRGQKLDRFPVTRDVSTGRPGLGGRAVAGAHGVTQAGELHRVPAMSAADFESLRPGRDLDFPQPAGRNFDLASDHSLSNRRWNLSIVFLGQRVEVFLDTPLPDHRHDHAAPAHEREQSQGQGVPGRSQPEQRDRNHGGLEGHAPSVQHENHARAGDSGTQGQEREATAQGTQGKDLGRGGG